jgi:hypothetical protein
MWHYFIFMNVCKVLWSYSPPKVSVLSHFTSHCSPLIFPFLSLTQALSESLQGWSDLIWALAILNLLPRSCYITRGHANKASLCSWKPAQAWPCSSGRGAQPWIPADPIQWSALKTDPSPWSWGWTGFSLLLFLKVIYKEKGILSVWVDMSRRKSVTVSWPWFSVFASVQSDLQLVESGGGLVQPRVDQNSCVQSLDSPSVSMA